MHHNIYLSLFLFHIDAIEFDLVICEFAFDSFEFEIGVVEFDATVNEFEFGIFVIGLRYSNLNLTYSNLTLKRCSSANIPARCLIALLSLWHDSRMQWWPEIRRCVTVYFRCRVSTLTRDLSDKLQSTSFSASAMISPASELTAMGVTGTLRHDTISLSILFSYRQAVTSSPESKSKV